jgi:ribulose bisphosphate carboxylase small subunit
MSYLSESFLSQYAEKKGYGICEYRFQADTSVFLSHSHQDKRIVKGLINYLAEQGIKVYVDWNDTSMPRVTSRETAEKIKCEIKENNLFWILATVNAMNSKWVPWEIGVADQSKKSDAISIIPVSDPAGKFHGSEYLQLYRSIESTTNGPAITKPNQSGSWQALSNFIKTTSLI